MTRIAFTSCMLHQRFDHQPVWHRILAENPAHLVLLGNSIYLDIDAIPQRMSTGQFAEHAHALYRAQLAVPEFDALLRHMAAKGGRRVSAIQGAHDFLWRDAAGADIAGNPEHRKKLEPSRVLFELFQRALAEPGSFPERLDDITPPTEPDETLMYEALPLRDDLWLHLPDGRSHRTETWRVPQGERSLLGGRQLDAFATAVNTAAPGALHLVASGSTGAGWQPYQRDWTALTDLAARHRLLMLSGDLCHNGFASHGGFSGWPLHEATASGAAVRDAVLYGVDAENFALAEVDTTELRLRFFEASGETAARRIERNTWTAKAGA